MTRRVLSLLPAALLVTALLAATPAATASSVPHSRSSASSVSRYSDFLKNGYMVGDRARFNRLKQQAIVRAEQQHPALRGSFAAAGAAPNAIRSFEGAYDTVGDPPDTTGAIGRTRYVEAINSRMDVYSRDGTHLGGNEFDTVLRPCTSSTGGLCEYSDPQVVWDFNSKRFFFEDLNADIAGTNNFFQWGFSKTDSPNSFSADEWCTYTADFGYGLMLPDYPKMAVTNDFVVIGVNIYDGEVYQGSDIDTISKPQVSGSITTCPSADSFQLTRTGPLMNCDNTPFASDPNPAQMGGYGTRDGWVVAVPDATNSGTVGNYVDIIKVAPDPRTGAAVVGRPRCVTVPAYAPPPPAVQKAQAPIPPYTIDTLDGRITHAMIAVDPTIRGVGAPALWTGHTVAGGGGSQFDWYEIDVNAATLVQNGTVSDPNLFVYNGAISSDRRETRGVGGLYGHDMVTGVSTSGTNDFPEIQMVSKVGDHPQSGLVMIKASPGPDASFSCSENPVFPGKCRWGDYSGAIPDGYSSPTANVGVVWLDNEWVTGEDGTTGEATWRTWIWAARP